MTCRVKVPMEALMSGTSSRTARVSAARRNLKEAAGKLPARGTRIAYEALSRWTRGPIDSKSNDIRIEAAYMRRVFGKKVTRLTLRDLSRCLSRTFPARKRLREESSVAAEVSRGHSKSTLNDVILARRKLSRVDQGPNCLTVSCRAFDVRQSQKSD